MVSVSINNPDYGELKVKDSDGYIIYSNNKFRYIDYLIDLEPDLYLIHINISGRNYYEILQLERVNANLEVKIDSTTF